MSKFQSLKAACGQQNVRDNQHKHCQITYLCQRDIGLTVGQDSSVDIATRYGLDGPVIESWLGRNFPHRSRPALGPTQPPVQWVAGLSQGVKRPRRGFDHPPSSSVEVKERLQLCVYSPTGSSWPVIGWTFPRIAQLALFILFLPMPFQIFYLVSLPKIYLASNLLS